MWDRTGFGCVGFDTPETLHSVSAASQAVMTFGVN